MSGSRPRPWLWRAVAPVVLILGLAQGASAAITEPPPADHVVTVFPDRDFVSTEGYGANKDLTVRVLRNGVPIGTADGTSDGEQIFEVNHPGGVCWIGSTPDLLAGDKVLIGETPLDPTDPVADAVTVGNVQASAAFVERDPVTNVRTGRVIVTGTAFEADGRTPMDLSLLEQRIVNPDLVGTEVGRRNVRAVLGDGLEPRSGVPGGWIAVYDQYTDATDDVIVAGQTRALTWQATNAAGDRLGITIHEVGEVGGPGMPECPAAARTAMTAISRNVVNAANVTTPLDVSGVVADPAITVAVSVPGRPAVNATVAGSTWTASIPAADLAALNQGSFAVTATFAGAGAPPAQSRTAMKDTVAPGPPAATPSPGTYPTAQSVLLSDGDSSAEIRWTNNGSPATASSPLFTNAISVTASQTIQAIAIDPAGNASAPRSFAYVIQAPPAGGNQGSGAQASGQGAAILTRPTSPVVAGISVASPRLVRLTIDGAVRRSVLLGRGLRVGLQALDAKVVRVAVYRLVKGKRVGRAVFITVRRVDGSTRSLRLTSRVLRRLRAGSYEIAVAPGASATELGPVTRVRFRVLR